MATVRMPSSRHAFKTRRAISPRLATSTLRNIQDPSRVGGVGGISGARSVRWTNSVCSPGRAFSACLVLRGSDGKKWLPEFDGLPVGDEAADDLAGRVGFDFIHQLHGFDDADDLPFVDAIADGDKWRCSRRRRAIIGSDNG